MKTFTQIKEFKRHKDLFEGLRSVTRANLLMKFADIDYRTAECLHVKEQSKIIFQEFYGSRGQEIMQTIAALSENPGM